MRVLLVSWDGGGAVPPMLGLGAELGRRGHRVHCLAPDALRPAIQRQGIDFFPLAHAIVPKAIERLPVEEEQRRVTQMRSDPGYAVDFRQAVAQLTPQVAVIDQALLSPLAAAEAMSLPCVVLVHVVGALGFDVLRRRLSQINEVRAREGLDAEASVPELIRRSGVRVVASTPLLDPEVIPESPQWRYVGPIFDGAPADDPGVADLIETSASPIVVVGLSSTYMDRQEELLSRVILGLGGLPVRGLIGAGPGVDLAALPAAENVTVLPWLSHDQVLPRAELMITHAGHSSVARAMSHGVPQLCIPLGRDQPFNAQRVAALGLGLHLSLESSPTEIAEAVMTMLGDQGYRAKSREAAASIAAMGDAASNAADIVESLGR